MHKCQWRGSSRQSGSWEHA